MQKIYKYGLAYVENNRILLCEPFAFNELILPGGVKENNENYIENLTREVEEELGKDARLEVHSLKYLGNFEDIAAGRINVVVEIELYLGKVAGEMKPSSEIKKLHWFGTDDDYDRLSPIIRNKILPFLIKSGYLHPLISA